MKIAIIGAGISGITAAYILRNNMPNCEIDIFEKSNHICGNCYDNNPKKNDYIQYYGPHIFHTNHKYIWNFLNKFSDFNIYQHKVKAYVDGNFIDFPLNKDNLLQFINTEELNILQKKIENNYIKANNAESFLNETLGKEITNKFFKNYSEKQWGMELKEIPVDIVKRIPIRFNNDNRYFSDKYQGIPEEGFTKLFKNMLKHSKAEIIYKKVNFSDVKKYDLIINTSPIDEFYNYEHGELLYRKINFKFKKYETTYQNHSVINYPNDYDFTRISEFNYFVNKHNCNSIVCLEYPTNNECAIPCYPIFWDKNNIINLKKYNDLNDNVIHIGRMAEFKYYNMDIAIHNCFEKLSKFNIETLKEIE
jgi:UDP-galactopyranose mutase